MRPAELRTLLADAGFVPEKRRRHEVWRHPTGVWTMISFGNQSEHRRLRSIRSVIRKAERAMVS